MVLRVLLVLMLSNSTLSNSHRHNRVIARSVVCHATWQSPIFFRNFGEIATPVCALVRNDMRFKQTVRQTEINTCYFTFLRL